MTNIDASVKDMEGAGIAWVADLAKVPYFCVKVVTDIVDGDRPTQEEFLQNLGTAAQELRLAVPKIIRFLAGKKFSEI
jgi:5'-methylthioadenosine nucleosidase